jgi:dihydroorotate dehydrogenase
MRKTFIILVAATYKYLLRPLIFLFDSETVHDFFVSFGEFLGKTPLRKIIKFLYTHNESTLKQKLFGIEFENPIGLSAGFDYKAKLTGILPFLDFGFESIGTITNLPYDGNRKPRLGRLIKTRSLMVNKGFRNEGIKKVSQKLKGHKFTIPIGISIGKTNTTNIKTQEGAIDDILSTFKFAEKSRLKNSYYELNISCPNLYGNIEFYDPIKLDGLCKAIALLHLSKPVFVKMPISNTNEEILEMMNIIIKYPFIKAVILGNLQKNRNDESFVKDELKKFTTGNFSGMPTQKRSNELIKLVYQNYGDKIKIVGCGGVFTGYDAYEKIKLGASLIQMITGLIFEGPQVVSRINFELVSLLKKDGFTNISQAVGTGIE